MVSSVDLSIESTQLLAIPEDGLALVPDVVLEAGDTAVDVVVHRIGSTDATAVVPVSIIPAAYVHPVRLSSAPIGRHLVAAAALSSAAGGLLLLRSRKRLSSPGPTVGPSEASAPL